MWVEHGSVGGEIGRASGVRLDIDTPLGGIETVGLEGAGAAEVFDLVNEFVATVVTVSGHAFGVFVGQGAAEGLDNGEGGEVFRRYELDAAALAAFLLLNEVMDLRIHCYKWSIAPGIDGIHGFFLERETENGVFRCPNITITCGINKTVSKIPNIFNS